MKEPPKKKVGGKRKRFKTISEYVVPGGLTWFEIAEADDYDAVNKVVSRYYEFVGRVTILPVMSAEEFLSVT